MSCVCVAGDSPDHWLFTAFGPYMSQDPLRVRLSDVRHADEDIEMSKSSNKSIESSMSVSDARKRFEQLSASVSQPQLPPIPKPRSNRPPVRHSRSVSSGMSQSISDNKIHRGQSSPDHHSAVTSPPGNNRKDKQKQEVNCTSNREKSKLKDTNKGKSSGSMDKGSSGRPETPGSESGATGTGEGISRKFSSAKNKLLKLKSTDKGKMDSTAENSKSKMDSPASSPSSKRKLVKGRLKKVDSGDGSGSKAATPVGSPTRRKETPEMRRRSFSDQVLASPNQEIPVHITLKRNGSGKIVGGSRPTSPRVIEDKELKINLTEGE